MLQLLNLILMAMILFATGRLMADPATPQIVISVDWEGRELDPKNLDAINRFRARHPEIKMVHFLNAAYFTKPGIDAAVVRSRMQSVLRPGDELGLHIHGWHSLFLDAGVAPLSVDSFWEGKSQYIPGNEAGHDAIIENYSVADIRKVLRHSLNILEQNGFIGIKSFRAGGWMAGPRVLEALVREGFHSDSSAVPPSYLRSAMSGTKLLNQAEYLWGKITAESQPFVIETAFGPIREFPNNAGLADYVIADQVLEVLKTQMRKKEPYVHFGFHLETADRYLYRVDEALTKIGRHLWWRRTNMKSAVLEHRVETTSTAVQRSCRSLFGSL